jgi:hypothetical protein
MTHLCDTCKFDFVKCPAKKFKAEYQKTKKYNERSTFITACDAYEEKHD